MFKRLRVFATNGDELTMQNAANAAGIKVEFGGIPEKCLTPPLKMERLDEEGNKTKATEWFVAYIYASTPTQVSCFYKTFMELIGQQGDLREFRKWLDRA